MTNIRPEESHHPFVYQSFRLSIRYINHQHTHRTAYRLCGNS